MGGLGNMLFQISTAYATAIRDNKMFVCDITDMVVPHKSFFDYKSNIFRNINMSDNLPHMVQYCETDFKFSEIPSTSDDLKIIGYFQSEKYFVNYRDEILNLFKISDEMLSEFKSSYSDILDSESCSIHVRRGDYLSLTDHHPVQPIEYYKKAVDIIGQDKLYAIFSDDIQWCIDNFGFIKKKQFFNLNCDYEELYLMSMCKDNIIANSTFSWWAAWLNTHHNKIVVAPNQWFGNKNSNLNTCDLYCDKWIRI